MITCDYNTASVTWNQSTGTLSHSSNALTLWGDDAVTNLWDLFQLADLNGQYANVDRRIYAASDEGARFEIRISFNNSGVSTGTWGCSAPGLTGFSQTMPSASNLYGNLVEERLTQAVIPCFNWRGISLFEAHFIPTVEFNPLLQFGTFVRNTQGPSASITTSQYYDTAGAFGSEALMIAIGKIWFGDQPGGADPYAGGGTSEPGEQDPSWDDSSDVISVPSAPSFSLITNSIIHAWAPAVSDLNNIGSYLWSNFDITDPTKTLSKVFQSPLESILSLHALPFAVSSGTAVRLTLAGFDTGVDLPPLTAQFADVPCGSIDIEPYWDNYLDYNPYTKITLCLPFAGQVTLDPDEVMGKTVSVTYRVDCLTGSFVCFVFIDGDKVLGQYAGNCALSIPISAADYGRFNAAILGVAASAASAFGAVASGGTSALGALGDVAGSAVNALQDAKVRVAHSGGLTGTPGFMGIQKPYLIIHRARQSVPEGYGGFKGYPLNVTKTLGECSGFTSVREIHLDGIPLTEPELNELRGILEGGIII